MKLYAKQGYDSHQQMMIEFVSRKASARMEQWEEALTEAEEDLALLRARACKSFCDRVRATS